MSGGEGYQVNLGGGADNEQGLARELFPAMAYADVLPALQRLFGAYQGTRSGDESFLAFARRHDVEQLRAMCSEGVAQA